MVPTNTKQEPLLATPLDVNVSVDNPREHQQSPLSPFSNSAVDFPSVFEEANDMILASILVYGLVDLRTLAAENKLIDSQDGAVHKLLSLPISAADIVRLVSLNKTTIQDEIGEDSTQLYLDVFDSLVEELQDVYELEFNTRTGETSLLASFEVVHVGDEFAQQELVHGICVHAARKRITVAFRGCTTTKDWKVTADPFLTTKRNPVVVQEAKDAMLGSAGNPKEISIHRGFSNYLFKPNQHNGTNKYEQIMTKLHSLENQYTDYSLYITGHSLGGALATVFSFEAAACATFQPETQKTPITCMPIASPMVGNLSFELAFKTLERQGRIRCLRITNYFDIFTQLPDRTSLLYAAVCWGFYNLFYLMGTFLFFLLFQNNVYRHVGMDLHLYGHGRYKIKHARGSADGYCWRACQDWKTHWKQALQRIMAVPFVCFCDGCFCKQDFNRNHTIQEHRIRLSELSSELQSVYLNDLYNEKRFEFV